MVEWWKVNCDAAVKCNNDALAFVVQDDSGLFVMARTKLIQVLSVDEAETNVLE